MLQMARDGDHAALARLLSSPDAPSIDSADKYGNTALHCAATHGECYGVSGC